MSAGAAFDIVLALLIVAVAAGAVAGRALFTGIALYVVYGLLLAIAWVRLEAVDVALAEAAIGAGLTGILLLGAAGRGTAEEVQERARPFVLLLCALLAAGLGWVLTTLAVPNAGLAPLVTQNLDRSGVENPVTAVLLNFRAYDTLLESVVLLIALVGVWALAPERTWDGVPGVRQHVRPDGVLAGFGRLLPPIGILVGVYLLWAGTSAPGGAFQAGTVLAAVWLLAMMAGLVEPPSIAAPRLRWALVAGPLLFAAIGLAGLAWGAFLAFPPAAAKALIIAVECALAFSIATTLALLVLGPPRRPA